MCQKRDRYVGAEYLDRALEIALRLGDTQTSVPERVRLLQEELPQEVMAILYAIAAEDVARCQNAEPSELSPELQAQLDALENVPPDEEALRKWAERWPIWEFTEALAVAAPKPGDDSPRNLQ